MPFKLITSLTPTNMVVTNCPDIANTYHNYILLKVFFAVNIENIEASQYSSKMFLIHKDDIDTSQLAFVAHENAYCYFLEPFSTKIKSQIISNINPYPKKTFPYIFIQKKYVAYDFLGHAQQLIKSRSIGKAKQADLDYTFGLEFETSAGIIPEHLCFENGIIPVYDGSISGLEYTSVVLKGDLGLNVLRSQFKLFKQFTQISKNCAIHIHMGGMPKSYLYAYILNTLCLNLQNSLKTYLHPWVYHSELYKDTGKNYAQELYSATNIRDYYQFMTGGKSMDHAKRWNSTQGHPCDMEGKQKWHIGSRYFWLNVINLLYYNRNKTIEFRFLPASFSEEQIIGWIYVFNAIAKTAENLYTDLLIKNPMAEDIIFHEQHEDYPQLKLALNDIVKYCSRQTSLEELVTNFYRTNLSLTNSLHTFLDHQIQIAQTVSEHRDITHYDAASQKCFKNFTFETKIK